MQALEQIDAWGVEHAAVGVVKAGELPATHGERAREFRWASVTKLLTAYACLVAVEEGTLDLDAAAGPHGSTVRHLLAHASGLPFEDGPPIAKPGTRRIYSNPGYELLAETLAEAAGMPFAEYLAAAVLRPLAMSEPLDGSPAYGYTGTLDDMLNFARELQAPTLVAPETLDEATSVVFPGLAGVLPGFGRMSPLDWGLGFDLKDEKPVHWTGSRNSARTFGHFGGAGTFLWVDPEPRIALACLTNREFDEWAKEAWPRLSDEVLLSVVRE